VDPAHQKEFFETAHQYLPFLEYNDLSPDMSGIRPKTQEAGVAFRDFVIRDEGDKGLPGLVDLVGIESPGLTAAPAIADYIENVVAGL
jgi:L-2-hydroxyglutarate oxidase LhgO